jgi:hypothetical protein
MIEEVKQAIEAMQNSVTEAVNGLDDALTKVEDRVGVLEANARENNEFGKTMRLGERIGVLETRAERHGGMIDAAQRRIVQLEAETQALELAVRELESLLSDQRRNWMSRDHRKVEPAAAEPTAEPAAEAVPVEVAPLQSDHMEADEPEAAQPKQRKPRAANGSHKLVAETVLDAANKGSLTSPFSRAMAVDAALPRHADVTPQIVSRALQELVEAGSLKMSGERAQARYSLP